MQARLKIGEVLLTATILGVVGHLLVAIVSGDSSLGKRLCEVESAETGEFGRLAKRQQITGVSAAASSWRRRSSASASGIRRLRATESGM